MQRKRETTAYSEESTTAAEGITLIEHALDTLLRDAGGWWWA